jgi:ATP-dependent helicase/nuclease subunit A
VTDLSGQDARAVASGIAHGDDLATDARVESDSTSRVAGAAAGSPQTHTVAPTGIRRAVVQGPGQAFGTAFHRLMECLTAQPNRSAESVRRELRLPQKGFDVLWAQARALLTEPDLARFFNPLLHRRALNELAIVTAAGELRRLDRVIEFDDEVWVLDYKTGSYSDVVGTALESEYRSQIEAYCDALKRVYAGKRVRAGLLFADGLRVEI